MQQPAMIGDAGDSDARHAGVGYPGEATRHHSDAPGAKLGRASLAVAAPRHPIRPKGNHSMRKLLILCMLLASTPLMAATPAPIEGTWQLVEVVMPDTYNASPTGVEARKENYSSDGHVCMIAADATRISPAMPCLDYRIQGHQRIVTDSDGESYTATFAFPDPNTLVVTQDGGSVWHYARLTGTDAIARKVEPVSVEVLKTARSFPAARYDTHDYSARPPAERLVGVWEVVAHENVDPTQAPPGGFFNNIWIFDGKTMARIPRPQTGDAMVADGKLPYTVQGNAIGIDGMPTIKFGFNEWGHLTLDLDGEVVRLKLISKQADKLPPLPPLKIALASLRGEADGN